MLVSGLGRERVGSCARGPACGRVAAGRACSRHRRRGPRRRHGRGLHWFARPQRALYLRASGG
eukprot:1957238-Alexandrium_andersonii.AAC.1